MDNISVVIRNRNEERFIGHAIQSVLDSFVSPEIIVIDNDSTDNSLGIVQSFTSFNNVNVYNMSTYTPGKSLNFGINKCSNDYILVLSAHSQIIECHWDKIWPHLEDHCVVGGRQIPIWNGRKITPRYIWSNFKKSNHKNLFSEGEQRYFLHNAFAFYEKETLVRYPFNEDLIGKEDRYWVNKRIKEGLDSYYDSTATCYHHYTDNGATWRGIG